MSESLVGERLTAWMPQERAIGWQRVDRKHNGRKALAGEKQHLPVVAAS